MKLLSMMLAAGLACLSAPPLGAAGDPLPKAAETADGRVVPGQRPAKPAAGDSAKKQPQTRGKKAKPGR